MSLRPLTATEILNLAQHTPKELAEAGGRVPFCWCRSCQPRLDGKP